MGGNAFPGLQMVRVRREDVASTVDHVVQALAMPDFTLAYAMDNLMGSAGKQDDSGDLDFAMNNKPARFVGEPELPVFKLREVAERARAVLPQGHVNTKTLKGGQFQTAFPVAGDPTKGYVQVDFVAGNPEWLKFSHFSPGKDFSPYKGVLVSTMLGVLAKMRKDFELFSGDLRVARVGLRFDLEKGLSRSWKMQKREGNGMSFVSADEFETAVATSPRFTRLENVTAPDEVLQLLFGMPVTHEEVNTFEKLVAKVREVLPDRFEEARERFLEAASRSAAKNDYTLEGLSNLPVWSQ
jgi:transposase-like protein